MSDSHKNDSIHGVVAYFHDVDGIMGAARKIRDAGFKKWDTYTPFPVHGIDEAMGIKPTILPWIVLGMGLTGLFVGLLLQWYTNAFDYVFLISGKPDWSLPANIPVTFEVIIAFSAFTTFFGMLGLNKLPHLSNPLHKLESFKRVTNDRFALVVEAADPNFDAGRVRTLLGAANADLVEDCPLDDSRAALPMWFHGVAALLTVLTFIPLAAAFKGRFATSEKPRYHVWPDMDWQRKRKTQTAWRTGLFEFDRVMQPYAEGTIAVGELKPEEEYDFHYGVAKGTTPPPSDRYDAGAMGTQFEWISGWPTSLVVDDALLERGRQRYDINCSICHGAAGNGLGSVARRAEALDATAKWQWIAPKSLLEPTAEGYSNGQLFHIASHGINTMYGYASSVKTKDRWAIVAYVRALQATQGVDRAPSDVDPSEIKSVPTVDDMRSAQASED